LTYLKDRTYKDTERVLIRDKETKTFTTHEELDTWHSERKDTLKAEEEVYFKLGNMLTSSDTFKGLSQIFPV
jgi:hypothetical protein